MDNSEKSEDNDKCIASLIDGVVKLTLKSKKQLGQYFTTDKGLKNALFKFIKNDNSPILEPSVGRGDLVKYICDNWKGKDKPYFHMYEIDNSIKLIDGINMDDIVYCDFLEVPMGKYKTIIGNPPYIKSKEKNIYIQFIEKCFSLLDIDGELIFIIPSDFFRLTSSCVLLNRMMLVGTFTHIYHPHKENLFEGASIDVLVFRYQMGCKSNEVLYNGQTKYLHNVNGMITFEDKCNNKSNIRIGDYFDVYVGIVSGKESVFKNEELGNISVLNSQDKYDKYIFVERTTPVSDAVHKYLTEHKSILISRKIKKFNEKNWYEWGAPRNIKVMRDHIGEDCIYVYNLTRSDIVAFKSTIGYFGGSLLMMKPNDCKINLDLIVDQLNSKSFRSKFMASGRFKIGHRMLVNSMVAN